jgi:hypothetical protein
MNKPACSGSIFSILKKGWKTDVTIIIAGMLSINNPSLKSTMLPFF